MSACPTPLRALVAAALFTCAVAAHAQSRSYDLPAQPLGSALAQIAANSGQQISIDAELVRGLTAPAVRGSYTAERAARAALAGSGLELMRTERGNWTLQRTAAPAPAPASAAAAGQAATGDSLAAVHVSAGAMPSVGTTEGTRSYTQRGPSSAATGLPLSLRETPQSVSVMTRQRLDDFKLETLTDVLDQTPGVTVSRQADMTTFNVRGSTVNLKVDGNRLLSTGWGWNSHILYTLDDMAEIDRIEVLKGSSGLVNGDGAMHDIAIPELGAKSDKPPASTSWGSLR